MDGLPIMTTFEKIKNIAKKRGLSLQNVAEKSGMSRNSLYHWKYDEPRSTSIAKVAKALDVSTDYLLGKSESISSENAVDLDDLSTVMTFQGEPIPEKHKEIVRDLLKNLKDKEKNDK